MSRPSAPEPSIRFFLALGLALLGAISLFLALLYGPSTYAALAQLRQQRYHDGTFRYLDLALTFPAYARAKALLLVLLAGSGAALLWQWRRRGRWYQELAALAREWRTAPPLLGAWRRLPAGARRTALALLALLTLVRLYYLLHYPLYGDEVVSYQYFVRPGVLAATSFYPIPNNHILYSALCWLSSQLSGNIYWTMRVPTFLLGTAGSAVVGLLLLRRVGYRAALLTTLLFGFFPYALFQSAVGRGYLLLALCGQLGFVAAVALLRGTARPRLAWAALVLSSLAGLYAMPTYLLLFASLFGALGLAALGRRDGPGLLRLTLAGLLTGLLTVLLYAPVLVVSGPAALFGNDYVSPRPGHSVFEALHYAQHIEGQLLGYGPLGLWPTLALSLGWLALLRWWRPARPYRALVLAALLALWLPYLLLAVREVYPPTRVLSYRVFFLLLLGALLAELLLRWRPLAPLRRRVLLSVGLPVLLWAGAGLVPFQRRAADEAQRNARVEAAARWLRRQGAHRVLTDHGHYQVYLLHYSEAAGWRLRVDAAPAPGIGYEFQLLDKAGHAAPPAAPLVLENADVRVFRLLPAQP
ncbi:hypothetical protein EJV47_24510 [Hymenobacter gummosus]|uniref:Glycosyltransferase RgtA/B/C/D-like domain-containing protein n=1 Tax=Hymenobacter gummosus TaxID=1776032 RepID=A0A3S0H5P2_9BACT|nr:hypothetical protein [Hymenobacter gummosus]RTQ45655.1 hypothetical protein EJV47_24510 [Hymenobacter gummosus]